MSRIPSLDCGVDLVVLGAEQEVLLATNARFGGAIAGGVGTDGFGFARS